MKINEVSPDEIAHVGQYIADKKDIKNFSLAHSAISSSIISSPTYWQDRIKNEFKTVGISAVIAEHNKDKGNEEKSKKKVETIEDRTKAEEKEANYWKNQYKILNKYRNTEKADKIFSDAMKDINISRWVIFDNELFDKIVDYSNRNNKGYLGQLGVGNLCVLTVSHTFARKDDDAREALGTHILECRKDLITNEDLSTFIFHKSFVEKILNDSDLRDKLSPNQIITIVKEHPKLTDQIKNIDGLYSKLSDEEKEKLEEVSQRRANRCDIL